jgi:hypothetical protein
LLFYDELNIWEGGWQGGRLWWREEGTRTGGLATVDSVWAVWFEMGGRGGVKREEEGGGRVFDMKEKRPEEAFGDAPAAAASDASKLENDDLP